MKLNKKGAERFSRPDKWVYFYLHSVKTCTVTSSHALNLLMDRRWALKRSMLGFSFYPCMKPARSRMTVDDDQICPFPRALWMGERFGRFANAPDRVCGADLETREEVGLADKFPCAF